MTEINQHGLVPVEEDYPVEVIENREYDEREERRNTNEYI